MRTQLRAQRAEVHEEGEGDGPKALGVDYVAAIELGEQPASGTRVNECNIRQMTDQKTIG